MVLARSRRVRSAVAERVDGIEVISDEVSVVLIHVGLLPFLPARLESCSSWQ
jgi:hypothetical protein